MSDGESVRDYCLSILESGDLEAKTRPPPVSDEPGFFGSDPLAAIYIDRPARSADLTLSSGAERLPPPPQLEDPAKRATCIHRFAHHELMAVELFAWALLAWPEAPESLRRGWLAALADEQRHLGLYLERLDRLGSSLGDAPRSDYFWLHVPALWASPHGPLAFLSAMGLTLEQANLDFTLMYRDAFATVGDEASARVCQQIHDEEQGHVRLALTWLRRLKSPEQSDLEAYEASVPFPLSASRAKGRAFSADARRAAGLDDSWIEYVRNAGPKRKGNGPEPAVEEPRIFPNLGAEEGDNWRRALSHAAVAASARLFGGLFARDARFCGVDGLDAAVLPEAWSDDAQLPAWSFLPRGKKVVAWLGTDEALRIATRAGRELASPPPAVVRSVHDKAFAHRLALEEGSLHPCLREAIRVFDPEELADVHRVVESVESATARWAPELGSEFALKPRLSSSGRGRVAGRIGSFAPSEIEGAMARLARCGGFLLEPWLKRTVDLSAHYWIEMSGEIHALGTLESIVSPSGVPRGHRGCLEANGSIRAGTLFDERLQAAGLVAAEAARERGYFGACGVDAFVYSFDGESILRPLVEFNARFTLGTVALGLVERARRVGVARAPGRFEFRVDVPSVLEIRDPDSGLQSRVEFATAQRASARQRR
ncbi:MAG: ferritin-like domain-containing protein [bacterium]|nr:ferritin-like domain-containing protein [bacterium]